MFKNLFPVRCKAYFNYVTGTFFPVGLCTSSQKWHGTEETRKTSQHHFTCPALLCSTESDFSDLVTWNWKSENRNVITHVELYLWLSFCGLNVGLEVGNLCVNIIFQTYSMSVYLVRQLTSPLLLQRLRMKGIRNPDHSRALSNFKVHLGHVLLRRESI